MSPLLGMVARRDGVDVGEVVDIITQWERVPDNAVDDPYPGWIQNVSILTPSGQLRCEQAVNCTFHPAPTPTQGQAVPAVLREALGHLSEGCTAEEAAHRAWALGEQVRQVRFALGMADAPMVEVLERIRELVRWERESVDAAEVARRTQGEWKTTKREPSAIEMTSDPPPPAPEGEERWYLLEQSKSGEFDHVVVMAGGWDIAGEGQEPDREYLGTGGFADWQEMAYRRSLHPVLPPLWASDAWTTDPLPAAPETGSVWWGWVSADGEMVEVIEQVSGGYRCWSRKGYGPDGRLCSAWSGNATLRASEAAAHDARRTVSPIARPTWAGTAPAGGEA